MRACEGCRRRKIKCDAATTNTWPCSACIRLKLHCVRPNGFDGSSTDAQAYELPRPQFDAAQVSDGLSQPTLQEQPLLSSAPKPGGSMYAAQSGYSDPSALYQSVHYQEPAALAQNLHYTTVPPPVAGVDPSFPQHNSFPTPPLQQRSPPQSPPDAYNQDPCGQQDLADLLGSLKVNEAGTGQGRESKLVCHNSNPLSAPYLNKMRLRAQEDEPALEDADEYKSILPPLVSGPGLKVRIPPELMPDEQTTLHYFDLYFSNAHPYIPVLDKAHFYHQWHSNRDSISPLVLEAMFAIAGRLADEPAQGQQWLALATSRARLTSSRRLLVH